MSGSAEDLLRRLLAAVDTLAQVPEVPAVEKLLQHLVAETQSCPSPVVSPPESVGLEKMLRSFLSGQQQARPPPRQRPIRRDWNGVVCFSCLGHEKTLAAALQLQHDAGLILSNVAFGREPFPADAAGGAVLPCSSGGALHGGHGIVVAT